MTFFKTPAFWYRGPGSPAGAAECALTPLSYLYDAGQALRRSFSKPQTAPGPVVCVGNIVAGGSGKTPTVLALHDLICDSGAARSLRIITRGYGGQLAGPVAVDPSVHRAQDVGDEPLLLALRGAQAIVSKDRAAGARHAFAEGADLVLMDDGFQNPTLHKDFSFLVIDGASGFGNGRVLPAGPLRERPEAALVRAQAVILIGRDISGVGESIPDFLPVFTAQIAPQHQPDLCTPYIAFAGLARPEKFRDTLVSLGAELVRFHAFADHHAYSARDLEALREEAGRAQARLITTEKDYVRLSPEQRDGIETLPVALKFDEPERVLNALRAALSKREGAA